MVKIISLSCPKCNNSQNVYRYGKDYDGRKYPICPKCGKASFLHHTTISNWCTNFAPLFDNMRLTLTPMLDFNSDEWHADETVIKIAGVKHYLWLVVDSETRFVIGYHLSPHRDSPQAFSVLKQAGKLGTS